MCCKCECTEAKEGKRCLTKYTPESQCLSPDQWVVSDPGVKVFTVPATTQFIAKANLFSPAIMKQVCSDGCIEVTVISGTLKYLLKPMGPNGCETFGKDAPAKFLIESHEITQFNWCSPDGAVVHLEALG